MRSPVRARSRDHPLPAATYSSSSRTGPGASISQASSGFFLLLIATRPAGPGVTLGPGTRIGPHAVITGCTSIGARNRVFQFASVGEIPQDRKYGGEPTSTTLGDDNVVRDSSGKPIPIADEQKLYTTLGLPFIEPELRESRGEMDAAEEDTLPSLITLHDIRGVLHCHSQYSDGKATVADMASTTPATSHLMPRVRPLAVEVTIIESLIAISFEERHQPMERHGGQMA